MLGTVLVEWQATRSTHVTAALWSKSTEHGPPASPTPYRLRGSLPFDAAR